MRLQVPVVLRLVIANAFPHGPLGVRVDVHLDDTVGNSLTDFRSRRARPAVEDKVHRFFLAGDAFLFDDVLLRVAQNGRRQLDVTRRIDTVDVTERRGNRVKVRRNRLQSLVHVVNLFRLGVQIFRRDVAVIDAVFLAAGDPNLHLQKAVDRLHSLQVLLANLQVLLDRFFGQVQHVAGKQRLSVFFEILLVRFQQAVEPPQ